MLQSILKKLNGVTFVLAFTCLYMSARTSKKWTAISATVDSIGYYYDSSLPRSKYCVIEYKYDIDEESYEGTCETDTNTCKSLDIPTGTQTMIVYVNPYNLKQSSLSESRSVILFLTFSILSSLLFFLTLVLITDENGIFMKLTSSMFLLCTLFMVFIGLKNYQIDQDDSFAIVFFAIIINPSLYIGMLYARSQKEYTSIPSS